MCRRTLRAGLAALGVALLGLPAGAGAASLPTVASGARPGPPVLYAPPPRAPQLENRAPFAAAPLLVSGTSAIRGGEFLYQDYLFDDRGADTLPLNGNRAEPGSDVAASTAGDVLYPTAERFAGNAADLVELRIKPTADAILYRVTLNSALDPGAAVVGIGIDTDRSGGADVPWPLGAGVGSPGLDRFVTAWGTGGETRTLPGGAGTPLAAGDVTMDVERNQMTIRVPRSVMDPGGATWRYAVGVGLWDDPAQTWLQVAQASDAQADRPASGDSGEGAPAVFNLGFRHSEPQSKLPNPRYSTFPGTGNWFEDEQAVRLKERSTGDFHADVDFAKLTAGATEDLRRPPGNEQARIYPSSLGLPEGVRADGMFPLYGGQLQPYLVTVPEGYRAGRPIGLTFALHSLGGTYTQYKVFSPNQLRQFGPERDSLVVTTLGHGTNGWYDDEGESDVFQVWADLARSFTLDSERVALTGYSMGGRGTFKLATRYPDLFGAGFTTVGPPAREIWVPPAPPTTGNSTNSNRVLESARWVPFMNWVEASDELVPYVGPRAQQARFDALGLRSTLWTFTQGEHFTLAILDEWAAARDFLGPARVTRDPWRVDYAFMPAADSGRLGLVADHAYWVSGLRAREEGRDRPADGVRAVVSARSLAFGDRDSPVRSASGASAGGVPTPAVIEGSRWDPAPRTEAANVLELDAANVRAGVVDGRRARLSGDRALTVNARSDGAGELRVDLPLRFGARVLRGEARLDRDGATIPLRAGAQSVLIAPGCEDRVAPRSRFARRARGSRTIRGRASDRGCGPGGTGGRLASVRVAVARRTANPRRCRHLGRNGRLSRARACGRYTYLTARLRDGRFSLVLPRSMPRGRYVVWSRGADRDGNPERKDRRRNLQRFVVR